VKDTYSATRKRFAHLVASVAPSVGIASIKVDAMNSIPEELAAYKNDPLVVHGKVAASLASTMLKLVRESDVSNITCPVLILAGELEMVVDTDAGSVLFDTLPSPNKLLKTYTGAMHDLPREPCKEQVFADIGEWTLSMFAAPIGAPGGCTVVVDDVNMGNANFCASLPESLFSRLSMLAPLRREGGGDSTCWSCASRQHLWFCGDEAGLLCNVRNSLQAQSKGLIGCFACTKQFAFADLLEHEANKHKDARAGQRASAAKEIASRFDERTTALPASAPSSARSSADGSARSVPLPFVCRLCKKGYELACDLELHKAKRHAVIPPKNTYQRVADDDDGAGPEDFSALLTVAPAEQDPGQDDGSSEHVHVTVQPGDDANPDEIF
jgi:hypothetical protein